MNVQTPSFEQIVRSHQRSVWRFLVAIGCNPAEAEDLTQETFVSVFRDGFEYRGERETANYLLKVAKNKFISSARRRRRAPLVSNLDDVDTEWSAFEQRIDGDSRVEALKGCLQELTARSRLALKLRYSEELDRTAMARELQLKENGVKTLLLRAREKLRACVERKTAHG